MFGCSIWKHHFSDCNIIGWKRAYTAPNAVYHSPFPYSPTAVVQGVLQSWAKDLLEREGFPINKT